MGSEVVIQACRLHELLDLSELLLGNDGEWWTGEPDMGEEWGLGGIGFRVIEGGWRVCIDAVRYGREGEESVIVGLEASWLQADSDRYGIRDLSLSRPRTWKLCWASGRVDLVEVAPGVVQVYHQSGPKGVFDA